MIDDAVDKSAVLAGTSHLLARTPRWRTLVDPRLGLGSLLLRGAMRAERKTLPEEPGQADRKAYIPRDMLLSLFQAEHEEHLDREHPEHLTTAEAPKPMGSRSVEPFSEGRGIDRGFVTGFLRTLPVHLFRRIRFRLPAGQPRQQPLAENARVVVVGDWGTGEGLAIEVAARMREAIEEAGDREVHVVHLGDIYYAGTPAEARRRFLDHWPVTDADEHPSWCLNGNHDMYSAGRGLTRVVLTDPRFAAQRTTAGAITTEFLLANRHWSLIGLDTSWKFRLRDPRGGAGHLSRRQSRWVTRHVQAHPDHRTMLFSHHQPITWGDHGVEPIGNLLDRTRALRQAGRLTGWLWGHEHKLIAYGDHSGIGYATCMGHGAILETPPEHPHPGEFDATFTDPEGLTWRMPGFAVLDLDGPTMRVRYLDKNGRTWRPEDVLPTPSADDGSAGGNPNDAARAGS
ncbi:metallophosphoesterase [Actinomycetospora endophytica]|uniref:Metallophosphoesterase n=1 Tax=Actinomycetospora endophytica TaxID=2291215 RepID=A0ABS8PII5_9PSEU|nr:metallophosphoesterase [Actinomycetospora endophytica]MCD2196794.1 metallophosphoesterase [Actinomycetospora endophytica]